MFKLFLDLVLEQVQLLILCRLFAGYYLQIIFQLSLYLCKVHVSVVVQDLVDEGQRVHVVQHILRDLKHWNGHVTIHW